MQYILFDKDGTLLDFGAYWIPVIAAAADDLTARYGLCAEERTRMLRALGIDGDVIDITGVFCGGTYEEIGGVVYEILISSGKSADRAAVAAETEKAFADHAADGVIRPTSPGLPALLRRLRAEGKHLFVVTADCMEITQHCLDALGITDCFDEILAEDKIHPGKPNPYKINSICERFHADKREVCMVGDTLTDLFFAENGGITGYGVGAGEKNRDILRPYAKMTAENIEELYERGAF